MERCSQPTAAEYKSENFGKAPLCKVPRKGAANRRPPSTNPPPSLETNSIASLVCHYKVPPIWPLDLLDSIKRVISTPCATPESPEFSFEMSEESAAKNFLVLAKYGMDLGKALDAQKNSPLGYGSEFRPPELLEHVFGYHPVWQRMRSLLTRGSDWPMEDLDDVLRKKDVEEALEFGNHKGATENPELLKKLVNKDVTHGYGLVLPLKKVQRVPGLLMAPMNIMNQNTIDEFGRICGKDRLTHDQSYKWTSGTSVNSRVLKDYLLPCKFGACIKRLANWAVAARRLYPNRRILATKIDYKSAYRRCHLHWKTAIQTCTQLPEESLAIIALRLTFGGAPGSFEWGVISESICDLAMRILHDEEWDPATLHAPEPELVPPAEFLDDAIPFGKGKQLIVDVPVNPRGVTDVFIDDTIGLTVDIEGSNNIIRLERAILLAIHVAARPKHSAEPIPREEMAALNKLLAEAKLEETKIILGWIFDFRRLTVALPENKYVAWTKSIQNILEKGSVTAVEIRKNIGRLIHLGLVIPSVHHFLSRLRELERRAINRRDIKVTEVYAEDLKLMLYFLEKAYKGVDMNMIAYQKPTHAYRSDSCPMGLGGYSHQGWAWRYYLPPHLQFRASNNLLEHIASIITPWIDILAGRLQPGDCSLSMTDSSTSEGWSRKTNFKEDGEEPIQATVRLEVARGHARRFMENGIKDYSQWFPGKENDVSDALSRDDDRSDEELTNILKTFVPAQLPNHFRIVPLPNEIVSWLTSLLQKLPVKGQLQERHMRTKLGRGADGPSTATPSGSSTTGSLTTSQNTSGSSLLELSPWLCVEDVFQDQLMTPWLKAQSEVPFHMWHRPSETMTGQTQRKTKTASLVDFYLASTGHSKTKTQTQSSRKPSQFASSGN